MATATGVGRGEQAGGEPIPKVLKRKMFHIATIGGMALLAAAVPRIDALRILAALLGTFFAVFLFMSFRPRRERKQFAEETLRRDKRFPAQGTVLSLIGALATLLVFPSALAAAGLAVLALGDGLSTLYAIRFGRLKFPWVDRYADAWVVGVAAGAAAASLVVPWWAALAASAVAQLPDLVEIKKLPLWADDNLLTPLLAAAALWLLLGMPGANV